MSISNDNIYISVDYIYYVDIHHQSYNSTLPHCSMSYGVGCSLEHCAFKRKLPLYRGGGFCAFPLYGSSFEDNANPRELISVKEQHERSWWFLTGSRTFSARNHIPN